MDPWKTGGGSARCARTTSLFGVAALTWALILSDAHAIVPGQVDTFQDVTTTMDWIEGPFSGNQPVNVSTGGPAGAGDRFLRNVSSGGGGAGSRQVMFNLAQWTGDYTASGTTRLTVDMVNLGANPLHMRIGIRGGPGSTIYGSTTAALLPADGVWRLISFDLKPAALTNLGGTDSLNVVMSNVTELRILSAATSPSFLGDVIAATLGVDNIRAVDAAAADLRVSNIEVIENVPRISFASFNDRSYRVERKDALTDSMWTTVTGASDVPGNGGDVLVDDPDPGAGDSPMRFYRVVLLAP